MATYSFLSVQASMVGPGGAILFGNGSGAAEEGISVDFVDDTNTMTIGADGSVMHTLNATKASTVTIRLLKTSPVNAQLTAMYNFQRANPLNHGRNVINIADSVRGDVYTCRQGAFKKAPGNQFAKNANMIEWTLDCGLTDFVLGVGDQ